MTKRLTISIPRQLYKKLKTVCKRGTLSQFISMAVEDLLIEKIIAEAMQKERGK